MERHLEIYTRVLTIAGSDSGGGAGIQADIKTFSACGCFGMSAITAITAQNTCGVTDIHGIPPATITAQIRAVLDDIGADAIKIGMLHSSEVILAVASTLSEYYSKNIILDPVMVATSGDRLIKEDAVDTLKHHLFPLAKLITPNIPEAQILTGSTINSEEDMIKAAEALGSEFSISVLLKGGHLNTENLVDVLWNFETQETELYQSPRIITQNSHGTGCTLSSAIAAYSAQGMALAEAVFHAEKYLHSAIEAGSHYTLGKGHGPVHHFYNIWS